MSAGVTRRAGRSMLPRTPPADDGAVAGDRAAELVQQSRLRLSGDVPDDVA
jgi:hypothetical protein